MKRSRFTEEQIIAILHEQEAFGLGFAPVARTDVARACCDDPPVAAILNGGDDRVASDPGPCSENSPAQRFRHRSPLLPLAKIVVSRQTGHFIDLGYSCPGVQTANSERDRLTASKYIFLSQADKTAEFRSIAAPKFTRRRTESR